jgi:hypothetical protein
MKLQTTRAIVQNVVVGTAMALTVFASWAVTGLRSSPHAFGAADICSLEGASPDAQRQCKLVAPHG